MNIQIKRLHIEELILSCYLNQNRANELDEMEIKDLTIPYELFKASTTTKQCAKAIFNLQKEKKPIDDVIVLDYVQSKTKINENDWIELLAYSWCTYDTMLAYLEMLKKIDIEENKMMRLQEI